MRASRRESSARPDRFDLLFFGQGDGVADDVDAFATWFLEADESGQPDPSAQNVFQIGTSAPNQMVIADWGALPEPKGFGVWVAGAALLAGLRRWRLR